MAMNNPFLKTRKRQSQFTLGSELKRLFGGFRSLATLLLLIAPLILSLAGGADWVQQWYYSFVNHNPDKRAGVFFLNCLTKNQAYVKACADTTKHKMDFWPLAIHPDPIWYGGLFLLAFLAYICIGNPNMGQMGTILADAFGIKTTRKGKNGTTTGSHPKFDNPQLPAPKLDQPAQAEDQNWIIGGTLLRNWQPDPGQFEVTEKGDPKKILTNRPPYFLTGDILRTNLMITAPQGSGKTTSVFRPAINFIRRSGGAAFVWDSKGKDFNRKDFDYNFDINDYPNSFKLAFYSGKTPEEKGERLGDASIPELSEDKKYFTDIAKDTLSAIVAGHYAATNRYPELSKILMYINRESESLQELIDRIPAAQIDEDEIERLVANLKGVQNLAEVKGDLLGNLRTALAPLTTPEISRFLVANKEDDPNAFTVEELLQKPGLIRLGLPISERPRIAPIIGRLFLAQFVYSVLSPSCNRDILKLAIVDEARSFISLPVANGMAQARSNNAGFVLAFQTLSQIQPDSLLETVFSLAGTKLAMSGLGNKDANRFSDLFGKVWLPFTSHNSNTGTSTNNNTGGSRSSGSFFEFGTSSEHGSKSSLTTNYGRGTSKNKGTSSGTQMQQRELFNSYEIRSLPTYHAIIESSSTIGERWPAQIIDMSQDTVTALETSFKTEIERNLPKSKAKKLKALPAPQRKALPAPTANSSVKTEAEEANYTDLGDTPMLPSSSASTRPYSDPRADQPGQPPKNRISFRIATPAQKQEQQQIKPIDSVQQANSNSSPVEAVQEQAATIKPTGSQQEPQQPLTSSEATSQLPGIQDADDLVDDSIGGAHITTTSTTLPLSSNNVCDPPADTDADAEPVNSALDHTNQPNQQPEQLPTTSNDQPGQDNQLEVIRQALTGYGVEPHSIDWQARQLLDNGHDLDFLSWLAAKPNVENLAAYLNWAISNNTIPTWPKPGQQLSLIEAHRQLATLNTGSDQPGQEITTDETEFNLIMQGLIKCDVAPKEAEKLARMVLDNGRDYEYVKALAANSKANNLAAYLNFSIKRNVPAPKSKPGIKSRLG